MALNGKKEEEPSIVLKDDDGGGVWNCGGDCSPGDDCYLRVYES